jgi:putative spermidine/putrescine transport system substrate-binding protein
MTAIGLQPTRRQVMKGAAAAALGVAAPFVRPARADAGNVVITDGGGTWGAAQKAAYFDPFEKEMGIKVTLVPYALPGKIRSSVTAGVPVADAVDLSGSQLPSFVRDGLLEAIDTKYFAPDDLASLSPVKADPHAIPSLFGAIVLAYGRDTFKQQPTRWSDLWDFDVFPGPRSLADGGAVPDANTFEIALLADGVTPEKLYPLDWDRALKSLDRLRPKIAKFWTGFAEPVQLLVDQSAVITSAYNGRVTSAQADGAPVEFSWNQGILGWDHWVVPKGAPNADNAFKFIAFATRADRQAAFAKLIDYGPTNSRAYSMLNAERSKRLPTAPGIRDMLVIKNYDWWAQEASAGVSNELHATRIWEQWLKRS